MMHIRITPEAEARVVAAYARKHEKVAAAVAAYDAALHEAAVEFDREYERALRIDYPTAA